MRARTGIAAVAAVLSAAGVIGAATNRGRQHRPPGRGRGQPRRRPR